MQNNVSQEQSTEIEINKNHQEPRSEYWTRHAKIWESQGERNLAYGARWQAEEEKSREELADFRLDPQDSGELRELLSIAVKMIRPGQRRYLRRVLRERRWQKEFEAQLVPKGRFRRSLGSQAVA